MGNWKAGILMGSWMMLAASAVGQSSSTVYNVEQLGSPGYYFSGVQLQGQTTIGLQPAAQFGFGGQWSQIGVNFSMPRNWMSYSGFSIRVENLENYPISLGVRWDINSQLNDYDGGSLDLAPREVRTFYLDASGFDPTAHGMMAPFPALQETYTHRRSWSPAKPKNSVYRFQIYNRNGQPAKVKLASVEAVSIDNSLLAFVDELGQYARRSWDWRKLSAQQIRDQHADELADISANPGPGESLGSLDLPETIYRDKWRAVKTQSGKAYFLTPGGRYFWSLGATSVGSSSETIVEGREVMFTGLPAFGDAKAQFYGTVTKQGQDRRTYSHYSANLLEKYGDNWPTQWIYQAKRRFESWGLNTLGSGSAVGSQLKFQGIPFTFGLTTHAFPTRLQTPFAFWSTLPDPYAANFTSWMISHFAQSLNTYGSHPNLVGVIVDGEHSWGIRAGTLREQYQVPIAALSAPKTQPSKQAFINHLFVKYQTVAALNQAWGTNFESWQWLRDNSASLTDNQVSNAKPDLSAFLYNFAKTYAFRVRAAIKANKPDVLWLGSKDSYGWCPNEAFGGLQLYADVISVTCYDDASMVPWAYFNGLKKPVLIAEFSFTSRDGNSFPQMIFPRADVNNQTARAERTRAYLDKALSTKNIIGVHWFTYIDQPITGRSQDGENFAFGLVDVTDQPYQEMVNMFRSFTSNMYVNRGL